MKNLIGIIVMSFALTTASSIGAWGQSAVMADSDSSEPRDLTDCAAAIAHRDSILLEQGNVKVSEENFEVLFTTALLLRSRGNLDKGYYTIAHVKNYISDYPVRTECWFIPLK